MQRKIFKSLPLESLNELLYSSVRSLLNSLDPDCSPVSHKRIRKHVELFLELIEKKKQAVIPIKKNDTKAVQ